MILTAEVEHCVVVDVSRICRLTIATNNSFQYWMEGQERGMGGKKGGRNE